MANERWGEEARRYWDDDRFGAGRGGYGAGGAYGRDPYDQDWRSESHDPRRYGYGSGYGYESPGRSHEFTGERYRQRYGGRDVGERYRDDYYSGNYGFGRDRYGYGYGGERGGGYRGSREGWGGGDWSGRGYEGESREWRPQRSWWDRTQDEFRSWAGDEEAERRRLMDSREQYRRGGYSGRGPRGYTRSDERIREDVCDRLCDDSRVDASDIEVNVSNGEVTLTGRVDSRDAKRCAEDLADDVSGVRNVQNNLRVGQSASIGGTEGTEATTTGTTRGTH